MEGVADVRRRRCHESNLEEASQENFFFIEFVHYLLFRVTIRASVVYL